MIGLCIPFVVLVMSDSEIVQAVQELIREANELLKKEDVYLHHEYKKFPEMHRLFQAWLAKARPYSPFSEIRLEVARLIPFQELYTRMFNLTLDFAGGRPFPKGRS